MVWFAEKSPFDISPVSLLKDRFKYWSIFDDLRETGIVPNKEFEERSRTMRLSKFPNDFRIEPWKEFWDKFNDSSAMQCSRIDPVNCLA